MTLSNRMKNADVVLDHSTVPVLNHVELVSLRFVVDNLFGRLKFSGLNFNQMLIGH